MTKSYKIIIERINEMEVNCLPLCLCESALDRNCVIWYNSSIWNSYQPANQILLRVNIDRSINKDAFRHLQI